MLVENEFKELQAFDSSYFWGKSFFGDYGLQNTFIYQPTFNMLEENHESVLNWKSRGLYKSKLVVLHRIFSRNIIHFTRRIGIQFSNIPLAIEQNN